MYQQLRRPIADRPASVYPVAASNVPLQKAVAAGSHRLAGILVADEPERNWPAVPIQRIDDSTKLTAAGALGTVGAGVAYATGAAGVAGFVGAAAAVGGLGYLGYRAYARYARYRREQAEAAARASEEARRRAYKAAFPAADHIYDASRPNYEKSAASGRKLAASYATWKPKNTEDRVRHAQHALSTVSTVDARYETISHRFADDTVRLHTSKAGTGIKPEWINDPTGGDITPYDNRYSPRTGRFAAHYNVKDEDGVKAPASNSEVIWSQYRTAIARLGMQEKGGLAEIERHNIINPQTNDTIFWSADGLTNCADGRSTTTIDRASPDFWPLLGTPNGNSAYWLLEQHGTEFGATDIRDVTYGRGSLVIRYALEK